MITPPPGWTVRAFEDGLVLIPPDGLDAGAIRYVERARPLRPVPALVAEHPAPPDFVATRTGPLERFATDEGEHAAALVIEGEVDGEPVERSFGFVFGDDFYARIAGLSASPAHFGLLRDTVRALARTDAHLLGVRRRRFVYAPPPGFQPVAGLFDTTWYPLDYPRRRASLAVAPALPRQPGLADALLAAAGGAAADARPVETPRGLAGRVAARGGTVVALLEDARYLYPVRLDAAAGERGVLDALVASIEPVPAPRAGAAPVVAGWGP